MKHALLLSVIVFGMVFGGLFLFAQEIQESPQDPAGASSADVESDYRLDAEGRIYQRISWTRANAYFYEIEIEKITSGAVWQLEMKKRTEQTFLELSLTPGMYRYRILNYNVLGRIGAVSEWTGIRVFAAKQPAAESFSPRGYFVDSLAGEFTLTVQGHDLAEEALLQLEPKKEGAKPLLPAQINYSPDESSISAVFSVENPVLGGYDLVITNPGGMKQTLDGFSVGFSHPVDINVSLGLSPIIPLGGYLFDTYDSFFYLKSFYGRVSVVPYKRLWGWLGVELTPQYADLKTKSSSYDLSGSMVPVKTSTSGA